MVIPFFAGLSLFPTPLVLDVLKEFTVPRGLQIAAIAPKDSKFSQPFGGIQTIDI